MRKFTPGLRFAFTLSAICLAYTGMAQIWVPLSHASGSRTINGRTVTVTSAGSVRTEQTFQRCGADPYTIGINYAGQPGSYSFAFSPATSTVRFKMSATNLGEVNSFYINGTHYLLTPANLQPLATCDPQYQLPLSIQGGDVIFAGPTMPGTNGQYGSGIVEITVPPGTGIDSIRIHNNGIMGGTTFGFAYWGFYAEASNNNPCAGDTLKLNGIPSDPGVTYYWTGPNGFTSTDQDPVIPNAGILHEGIYTLRTTFTVDTAYDTTLVKVRPVPPPPTASTSAPGCRGTTIQLNSSGQPAGSTTLWTGPNGYKSNYENATIRNVRERDTGIYTVITILDGCPSIPVTVRVNIHPPAESDTVVRAVCQGYDYDYFGTRLTQPGYYSHTIANGSRFGCDSIDNIQLVWAVPNIDTITETICQGTGYPFNNTSITTAGFYMDTVSNRPCDSMLMLHLVVTAPATDTQRASICLGSSYVFNGVARTAAGVYTDTLKTASGCDSLSVLELQTTVNASDTITATICQGGSFSFAGNNLIAAGTYLDTLKTASECDSLVVLHLYVDQAPVGMADAFICEGDAYLFGTRELRDEGTYLDTLKAAGGCDSVVQLQLRFYPQPEVAIVNDHDGSVCQGDSVLLSASGAYTYTWMINDRTLGAGTQIQVPMNFPVNLVELQGVDINNCKDTASVELETVPCCELYIPSAFSPNGDGRNDRFGAATRMAMDEFVLRIFNRWGALIYTGQNIYSSWDGTYNGKPADVGTYYYHVSGKCITGKQVEQKGDFTLIR